MMLEKAIITLAWFCTFPLLFLDQEILGFRRYLWIVAAGCGLFVTLILEPTDEYADLLDKITMACVSITIVPHFIVLVRNDFWMGICVVPPFFLVVHLSLGTTINSIDYWKLRSFLHMGLFLPYLNHLPSSSPPSGEAPAEPASTISEDAAHDEKLNADGKVSTSRSQKTTTRKKRAKK